MLALKMPDTALAPVLGMMMRRLLEHERDVWLLVVWYLGIWLGDPEPPPPPRLP
jgi:hypothetical protein